MKFLLVSPLTSASGSSIRFWNIARELHASGHRVVFSDRRSRIAPSLHACAGVRYAPCPSTGVLPLDIVISLLFTLALLVRHIDSGVFYALKPGPNNCLPALLARMFGKKIVLDVDDLDYAYLSGGLARRVFRFFFDAFPKMFHLVTYHTPHLHDYLAGCARVPERKLYYLAQGVSPVFLQATPPAPSASLIYVATLGITSDFDDLIPGLAKLFAEHPAVSMSVVGDGRRRSEFERMVREAGIHGRVRFTGTIDHTALPAFIAGHRIGINYMRPSTVNQCRAILKIREYLACGLDVVCNDVGDVGLFREYIHVRQDITAMFEVAGTLLDRPPAFNTAGRAFMERSYRWNAIVEAFERRLAQK